MHGGRSTRQPSVADAMFGGYGFTQPQDAPPPLTSQPTGSDRQSTSILMQQRIDNLADFTETHAMATCNNVVRLEHKVNTQHQDLIAINECLYRDLVILHEKHKSMIWMTSTIMVTVIALFIGSYVKGEQTLQVNVIQK